MRDTIQAVWQQIEDAWQTSVSPDSSPLAQGASEDEIRRLEDVLEIALPEEVRASYRMHNGGFTVNLVSEMDVLTLDEIAGIWKMLTELLADEGWASQAPYYFSEEVVKDGDQEAGPVQPVWYHRHWIPIASDSAGNLSCLDLAPAPGGTAGQIIDWDHECGPSRVLFSGFQQLLEAFADQLRRDPSERGE